VAFGNRDGHTREPLRRDTVSGQAFPRYHARSVRVSAQQGPGHNNPTAGLRVDKPKTDGPPVWTEEDIAKFEERWPRGRREHVMLDVFLYTGLRLGDAARLGKQHVRNGVIEIDTEKTGMRQRPDLDRISTA
jgi:integrase